MEQAGATQSSVTAFRDKVAAFMTSALSDSQS